MESREPEGMDIFLSEAEVKKPTLSNPKETLVNTASKKESMKGSVRWILPIIIATFMVGNLTGGAFVWTWTKSPRKEIIYSMFPTIMQGVSAEGLDPIKVEKKSTEKNNSCMDGNLPSILSEEHPAKCMTTKGNTFWDISNRYCLDPWFYEPIMADNGIREAEKLPVGIELTIRCREITPKDEEFLYGEVPTTPAEPNNIIRPNTSVAENTSEVVGSNPVEIHSPIVEEGIVGELPVQQALSKNLLSDESEVLVESAEIEPSISEVASSEETLEKIEEPIRSNEKKVLKEGLYVINVNGFSVNVGVHPTSILIGKDEDNLWKQRKTVTYITDDGNNSNRVIIPIRKDVEFGQESSVAFDQGDGNVVQLTYEDLVENRVRSTKGLDIVKLEDSEYQRLLLGFPKKPSRWSMVGKTILKVGATSTIAYFTSGGSLLPTIFPSISEFVGYKRNQAEKKAFRLLQGEQK